MISLTIVIVIYIALLILKSKLNHKTLMQNQNPYSLFQTQKYFYIRLNQQIFGSRKALKINRQTGKITEINQIQNQQFELILNFFNFSLLLGIIVVKGQPFLLVATQSKIITKMFSKEIRIIKKIQFIQFNSTFTKKSQNYTLIMDYIDCIKNQIFKDNFYFSYFMDLTLNQQNIFLKRQSEDMYFWNHSMLKGFINNQVSKFFLVPVIQGFVESHFFQQFQYLMISRRSKFMSGTRFNCRGTDDDGNVANFVQTQQILLTKQFLSSYVQLRGSIPIYWKQNSKTLDVNIYNNQKNENMIKKHYENLQKIYGCTHTINLLGKKKQRQRNLTQAFKNGFLKINLKKHTYQYFDIHDFLKNKTDIQKSLDNYLNSHKDMLLQDYFVIQLKNNNKIVKGYQKKFNRINCLDCQDRTNAMMSKISKKMMLKIFQNLSINQNNNIDNYLQVHKRLWVKNGQKISMIYSGTGSVATYITEGQQSSGWTQSISNLFIEVKRMYLANVNDGHKQQCINIILGLGFESVTDYFQSEQSFESNGEVSNYQLQ